MIAKEGEAILNKENQFQQNINSEDPFIQNLYSDLNERINAYEQEDAVKIEKMKWSDATGSIFFMILIIAYLIYSFV
ncbi:hypothetical protein [Peribacillus sp. YIM B13477]|uniref:hypothetical protein n=1 Tax=Peribacillus sp. YIM B13477 TaxID=3366300 RepID=UPI00366E5EC9